ncbi:hypothetical protein SCP_0104900 [Sparassis crispa]|uniref:Uncharacterized protein n=1 Tax=Sparassis crispa TaxID=139825 RepID=A0A401G617_9APHY|nr:hypothetical protein SCP_0104900 [Sparassis crispa]GBE77610.1 hypothetical protein SCP_0104900 [Sparassis crispa]
MMPPTASTLSGQLEELHLLRCSLLPGESLTFDPSEDTDHWCELLDAYAEDPEQVTARAPSTLPLARFAVQLEEANVWFDVELPAAYRAATGAADAENPDAPVLPRVSVKSLYLAREEQARWQAAVQEAMVEVRDSEYPVYDLISTHLLPLLHAELEVDGEPGGSTAPAPSKLPEDETDNRRYHALLTSHHLVAPSKRRALHAWAAELALAGFAKLGHPGVLYCSGTHGAVTEFVRRVKALQWLALRVRFIEPLTQSGVEESYQKGGRWIEFEKVGEVVAEMRRLGRERFVVEMGIGSAGAQPGACSNLK